MTERKAVSKTLRFEVFKRDSFTCQYCGRKAPDIVLEIEHVHPVSLGGDNDIMNLVTSCEDCNDGKGARPLDDNAVVEKKRRQLERLQERREQIDMMMQWQEGLRGVDTHAVDRLVTYFCESARWAHGLNENGRAEFRKLLAKFSLEEILQSIEISTRQYIEIDEKDQATKDSVEKAFNYVSRIAHVRRDEASKPYLKDLLYIRGIVRNRYAYCNEEQALEWITMAYELGMSVEDLKRIAKFHRNWSGWRAEMLEFIDNELGIKS